MKQILKHLAKDIDAVIVENDIANETRESNQTGPNFSSVIKKWKLDRAKLDGFIAVSEGYAMQFNCKYPRRKGLPKGMPDYTGYDANHWRQITEILHYPYMAGNL